MRKCSKALELNPSACCPAAVPVCGWRIVLCLLSATTLVCPVGCGRHDGAKKSDSSKAIPGAVSGTSMVPANAGGTERGESAPTADSSADRLTKPGPEQLVLEASQREMVKHLENGIQTFMERNGRPVEWAIRAAQTNSTPDELREWALVLLTNTSTLGTENRCITTERAPRFIENLLPGGGKPLVFVYPATSRSDAFVQLDWGGGFGHYGLLIGSEHYRPPSNWVTKKWTAGIYGWQTSE